MKRSFNRDSHKSQIIISEKCVRPVAYVLTVELFWVYDKLKFIIRIKNNESIRVYEL
jgi:hypothetical protein